MKKAIVLIALFVLAGIAAAQLGVAQWRMCPDHNVKSSYTGYKNGDQCEYEHDMASPQGVHNVHRFWANCN
jgi:hypothetical protein